MQRFVSFYGAPHIYRANDLCYPVPESGARGVVEEGEGQVVPLEKELKNTEP